MSQSINSTGRTGDCGDGCYCIEDGPLTVTMVSYSGTERILAFLGRGAIIGELSIIDGLPCSVSVVAVRDAALSCLSRAAFEAFAKASRALQIAAQASAKRVFFGITQRVPVTVVVMLTGDASENGFWLRAGNPAVPSFYVVLCGGHRSAPRMLAALAGVVHDSQRAEGHEHNRDDDDD